MNEGKREGICWADGQKLEKGCMVNFKFIKI